MSVSDVNQSHLHEDQETVAGSDPAILEITDNPGQCRFWLGMADFGTMTPEQLLNLERVNDVLMGAASRGLTDEKPLMLVNSQIEEPTYVFLLPIHSISSERVWVRNFVDAVKSWQPESVGFYLPPQLLPAEQFESVMHTTIANLVTTTAIRTFYLFQGEYSRTQLLNSALDLRKHLCGDGVEALVHHM